MDSNLLIKWVKLDSVFIDRGLEMINNDFAFGVCCNFLLTFDQLIKLTIEISVSQP